MSASGEFELLCSQPPHVLLVDDEPRQLELCASVMKLQGFSVKAVSDPRLAAVTMAAQRPDLAILDYDMPFMNGCELAGRLKRAYPALKVILHSGLVEVPKDDTDHIDAFVSKGQGVASLLKSISELLPGKYRDSTKLPARAG
ncbi:MAG: response regulator receiver protein [Candidatus Angelobacter sp.]|jgi:CheY-like chemotaxis protein|nr:response regulator receiver protein [Candidatus Angelobacter sp.]